MVKLVLVSFVSKRFALPMAVAQLCHGTRIPRSGITTRPRIVTNSALGVPVTRLEAFQVAFGQTSTSVLFRASNIKCSIHFQYKKGRCPGWREKKKYHFAHIASLAPSAPTLSPTPNLWKYYHSKRMTQNSIFRGAEIDLFLVLEWHRSMRKRKQIKFISWCLKGDIQIPNYLTQYCGNGFVFALIFFLYNHLTFFFRSFAFPLSCSSRVFTTPNKPKCDPQTKQICVISQGVLPRGESESIFDTKLRSPMCFSWL